MYLRYITTQPLSLLRFSFTNLASHIKNPQITKTDFLEFQWYSDIYCSLLGPPLLNPSGQIEESWVVKLLPKFHDDPTVDEGERTNLPWLRNSTKNPKISLELSLSLA
jgi:hypothetical protein